MIKIKGWKGVEYEFDRGWLASDCNGRSGEVIEILEGLDVVIIRTSIGTELELEINKISFVYPPEDN